MPMFIKSGSTLEDTSNTAPSSPEVKLDYYEEVYRRGYVQIKPELIRIGTHLILVVLAMIAGRFFIPMIRTLIKTKLG